MSEAETKGWDEGRKAVGEGLCSPLGMGAERKERPQRVSATKLGMGGEPESEHRKGSGDCLPDSLASTASRFPGKLCSLFVLKTMSSSLQV